MITIICGTNRPNNESQKFVEVYKNLLNQRGETTSEVYLERLPQDLAFANDILSTASIELRNVVEKQMIPAQKLVVIAPEYNGSFPGILKSFIDCVQPKNYIGKTVALVGISSGRSGNLRGMDHLTGIFHYLGANVLAKKVDIARIYSVTDDNGYLTDEFTIKMLNEQIDQLLN